MPATSPVRPRLNEYYPKEDDYFQAVGEAMREEYRAIVDAGFILQLIEAYEREHTPITDPDPIDFLRHLMEARELSRNDLEPFIGSRARLAEVLNRVRPLTLDMIRRLSAGLKIPADVLVRDYKLQRAA